MSVYLGIESKEPLPLKLVDPFHAQGFQIETLRREAVEYLNTAEMTRAAVLENRLQDSISEEEAYNYFRSNERQNNTRLIIQYLVKFCEALPDEADIMGDIVNPFEQMREFTAFHIHQLEEKDVVDAILREHAQLGLLKESNRWYYQGQIRKCHQEMQRILERAILPNDDGYTALFTVLRDISRFWFSVRNDNLNRCRRSDMYIYQFSVYLLKKVGR